MAEEQAPNPQATPGKDVFISYASPDRAVADAVCAALEAAGVTCWIAPRDVTPGEFYAESIVHALDSSKVIALVLSQHAADSNHVLREVERASSKRHPVVSLRVDDSPLPAGLEYFLNTSQWLDASASGVDRAMPRLVDAVRSALALPSFAANVKAGSIAAASLARRPTRGLAVLAAIMVAAVGYIVVDKFWVSKHVSTAGSVSTGRLPTPSLAISDKSIAVLPFVDMSEKHDQEYFSDGLSEELIDHLAHIPDLKVIARTSSFAFKGKNEDMRSIATKLGVANLLEGSVRKAGGEFRITAQLIRASDGVHLWSEIYERKLNDIFKVQDEISTTVAKALNAALNSTNGVGAQPASKGTTNMEAYNLVLEGNHFFIRDGEGDYPRAAGLYQQALKLDPHYAVAWAKLALVYGYRSGGALPVAEAEVKGLDAVQRALAIDPNCAEAYFARGNILRLIAGDWTAARIAYEKAVALDPHGEAGDYAQGFIFDLNGAMSGRYDDIIDWAHRRLERDPLDTDTMWELGWDQLDNGQLNESAATARRLLELNPDSPDAQSLYVRTLLMKGRNAEALAAAEQESDESNKLSDLAYIYWAIGRRPESDSALGALARLSTDGIPYDVALVHAYRGEADAAFAWLDRAYQERKGSLEYVKTEHMLRNLHGDPRFNALLRKVKLLE